MHTFMTISFAIPFFGLALAYAVSPVIAGSGNASLLVINSNSTELSAPPFPPAPPGFSPELHWDASVPLFPAAVYVTAIRLMYGLSQQKWTNTIDLVNRDLETVEQPGYNATIHTNDFPPITKLTTERAVRALFEVVRSMGTQDPGFYKVTTNIKLNGELIGRIRIQASPPSAGLLSGNTAFANISTPVYNAAGNQTLDDTSLTSSGEIPDPEDSRFKLTYTYIGNNIRSQSMFSAVLAGLARVAQYNNVGPCPWISALSFSGDVEFLISAFTGQLMLGWHVSRTFYLLVYNLFLVRRVLKEMGFTLFYYGTPIAEGYMRILRVEGEGGERVVASE